LRSLRARRRNNPDPRLAAVETYPKPTSWDPQEHRFEALEPWENEAKGGGGSNMGRKASEERAIQEKARDANPSSTGVAH
jgi:hypothetical protein